MSDEILNMPCKVNSKPDVLIGLKWECGDLIIYTNAQREKVEGEFTARVHRPIHFTKAEVQCLIQQLIDGYQFEPETFYDMSEWIHEHAADFEFYTRERY